MHRPTRLTVLAAATVAIMAGGAVAVAVGVPGLPGEGGKGHEVRAAQSALPPSPHGRFALTATPASGWIATLSAPTSYSATPGGAPTGTLPATNPYGGAQTLAVLGQPTGGWADVELPMRPNGSTGWISTGGVRLTWTPYSVTVDIAARSLTVRDGSATVMTVPAAVGAPDAYTPKGQTYLWELIRPDNTYGAYGPYIFGLAEFSDTYTTFNGGDAQIGIHGNDEPWSIGQPVSHGCVRLDNDVITKLAAMLPLGTPVTIG